MTTELAPVDETLLRTLMPSGSTKDDLAIFSKVCERTKLDPFSRQIYATQRWDSNKRCNVLSFQVSIDGFRTIAERNGQYAGQLGPMWCGEDGVWKDVWLSSEPPKAAKVGIVRKDFKEPLWAVAKFDEYVQKTKEGKPNSMWLKMAANQIAKCAEALGLRRAFPNDLSGLYTSDEMAQATPAADEGGEAKPEPRKVAETKTRQITAELLPQSVETQVVEEETVTYDESTSQIEDIPERPAFQPDPSETKGKIEKLLSSGVVSLTEPTRAMVVTVLVAQGVPRDDIKPMFIRYAQGLFSKEKWEDLTEKEKIRAIKDAVEGVIAAGVTF